MRQYQTMSRKLQLKFQKWLFVIAIKFKSKQVAGIIGIEDGSQAFMYIIC